MKNSYCTWGCASIEHRSRPPKKAELSHVGSSYSLPLGGLLAALSVAGLAGQNVKPYHSRCVRGGMTYFLFGLQALNDGGELRKDFVGLLMVLNLGRDQLG